MRFLVINGPDQDVRGAEVVTEEADGADEVVDLIFRFDGDGIVVNADGLADPSGHISDVIRRVATPVVAVSTSDVEEPESTIAAACVRTIHGRGPGGYLHALRHLVNRAAMPFEAVRYGPEDDNIGDLRVGGEQLVVLVHGGLWRREFERDTTESLAVDLTRRGFTTWNLEYRRLGTGGGWPASGQDVLTALDSIPRLGVGSGQVSVIGHSAGAHLAMWAADRTSNVEVAVHVAMAPLLDLAAAVASNDVGAAECRTLLDQGVPDPMEPGTVPTVLVHGDRDQVVPVERSTAYAAARGLKHHRTDCDHFSLLDPTKPEWSWVIAQIENA